MSSEGKEGDPNVSEPTTHDRFFEQMSSKLKRSQLETSASLCGEILNNS